MVAECFPLSYKIYTDWYSTHFTTTISVYFNIPYFSAQCTFHHLPVCIINSAQPVNDDRKSNILIIFLSTSLFPPIFLLCFYHLIHEWIAGRSRFFSSPKWGWPSLLYNRHCGLSLRVGQWWHDDHSFPSSDDL